MKSKIFLLLVIFLIQEHLISQDTHFSIELNAFRIARDPGVRSTSFYIPDLTYINGFNLNYEVTEKWEVFVGARKLKSKLEARQGTSYESTSVFGFETRLGVKRTRRPDKWLNLSSGYEILNELSIRRGHFSRDAANYEINHRRNFFGGAVRLDLESKTV